MTDDCTWWWEGAWSHCCRAHDLAYAGDGPRLAADWALAKCVASTGYPGMAAIMFVGVALFGWWFRRRGK